MRQAFGHLLVSKRCFAMKKITALSKKQSLTRFSKPSVKYCQCARAIRTSLLRFFAAVNAAFCAEIIR
jgi:hypothetical protein